MVYVNKKIQEKYIDLSYDVFRNLLERKKINQKRCMSAGVIEDRFYCSVDCLGPGDGSIFKIISKEDFDTFEDWSIEKEHEIVWSEDNMLFNVFSDKNAWKRYTFRPSDWVNGETYEKEENKTNGCQWTPLDDLSVIPEMYFSAAKKLENYVNYEIVDENVTITHPSLCENSDVEGWKNFPWQRLYMLADDSFSDAFNKEIKTQIINVTDSILGKCDNENCVFHVCPYRIAAYIKYIQKNNTSLLDHQRECYVKNKYEIDAKYSQKLGYDIDLDLNFVIGTQILDAAENALDTGKYSINKEEEGSHKGEIRVYTPDNEPGKYNGCYISPLLACGGLCNTDSKCPQKCIYKNIALVDYLRRKGKYKEFYEKQKCIEREIKRAQNYVPECVLKNINSSSRSFYGYVSGDDRDAVKNAVHYIARNPIEKKHLSKEPCKFTLLEFAEHLCGFVRQEKSPLFTTITENTVFILTGISEFIDFYNSFKNPTEYYARAINHLIKRVTFYPNNVYLILAGTEKEVNAFLGLNKTLELMFSENKVVIQNKSCDEIFKQYTDCLDETLKKDITNEFRDVFQNYTTFNNDALPFKNEALARYLADYAMINGSLVLPPDINKRGSQSFDDSISQIVGMDIVKDELKKFKSYIRFIKLAQSKSLKIPSANMHMLFTGSPGTGKTMIARIMAKVLYDMGYLKENKLIEVERKDLIGEYVGHTAPKVSKVIESALGGVLFIDEAYSLVPNTTWNDFGKEAIATLIKAMEDKKDELVVIFAGYEKEMRDFVESNPGIASRIGYTFKFEDYSKEELVDIFKLKISNCGFVCSKGVIEKVEDVIDVCSQTKNFGNGRFVDRLIQNILINHASNCDFGSDIEKIQVSDIPTPSDLGFEACENPQKRKIGYIT